MRELRFADRISLCVMFCCSFGLAACSDETGADGEGPSDDSSVTDDPTTPSTTEAADSGSTTDEPDTDTDDPSAGSSGDESSSGDQPACNEDAECDDAEPCTEDHCVEGACVSTDLDGVPVPDAAQTEGDCVVVSCVAGSASPVSDDSDLPVDDDDCTEDVCTDGVPSNPSTGTPMCIPEPICDDGLDDDEDGTTDCQDPDCDGIAGCELGTELSCADAIDNDGDVAVDCQDADCDGQGLCELGNELTCGDGFDNDGDLGSDCQDADCDGSGVCEFGAELSCLDGFDNDVDGAVDCDDDDCGTDPSCVSGEIACNDGVDNDGNGLTDGQEPNCGWVNTAMACPAGHAYGFSAIDLPQSIPSVGTSTRNSYIPVGSIGTVAAVVVRIDIAHTYDSDLDITLFSPSGTSRELSTDNGGPGGSEDNFTGTVFSDAGPGVIGTAGFNNPPFAGTYQPEQAFVPTLTGQATAGDWNLRVFDQFNLDGGTFNTFQLGICTQ